MILFDRMQMDVPSDYVITFCNLVHNFKSFIHSEGLYFIISLQIRGYYIQIMVLFFFPLCL